ncbi:MAG: hypothetical protein ARM1_0265 [Candidatus Micrarchaeota archaeon]|nr:MAG: hypothetical protein ARM1_0265 [Candidatus Micrarchaeota archaeon]
MKEIDNDELERIVSSNSERPALVEFMTDKCVWCARLKPILEDIEKLYADKLDFYNINLYAKDSNKYAFIKYKISVTPTIKIFYNSKEILSITGYLELNDFKLELEHMFKRLGSMTHLIIS